MEKPKASSIPAGPETDLLVHTRVFDRTDRPAPPYSTDAKTAEWLAERYELGTIPIMGTEGMKDLSGPPIGYVGTRSSEPREGLEGHMMEFEPLAQADSFELAIVRSVLLIEGIVERDFVMREA